MLSARFDIITKLGNRDEDYTDFIYTPLTCVPAVGEVINLRGNPYIVLQRSWAIDEGTGEQWVYLRCVPASSDTSTNAS